MDWSEERYVRIYTRDTPEWVCWPWQARALMPLLLRKVDRTGVLGLGRLGVKGLAALVGLPVDVTQAGVDALVDDGSVTIAEQILVVRNFLEAQEVAMSDKARQREHREKRRAKLLKSGEVVSHAVTPRHAVSQSVTPSLALPSRAVPNQITDPSTCVDATAPEDQLVSLWNSTAAPEMPRCQRLTDGRRKKARELLKVIPLDEWPALIATGNASDFCRGIGSDFRLSLAWMLKSPENALKVLEGNYANGGRKVDVRRGHVRAEDMNFDNVPIGEIRIS